MALAITTVTNSIAALSVTGLTIKDVDEILYAPTDRECPLLYPEPINFISDLEVLPSTFGTMGSGYFDVKYTLRYTFLYQAAGADRGSLTNYQGMVQLFEDFIDEIIANDALTGCVDIQLIGSTSFGVVLAPNGDTFLGAEILLRVHEQE